VSELEEVRLDIAAFADDEDDVMVERDGTVVYQRSGVAHEVTVEFQDDALFAVVDGVRLPYRKFLTHDLAGLPQLAARLLEKRPALDTFIEPRAEVQTTERAREVLPALEALRNQCTNAAPFASRVLFITADAGAGKTALLRAYQAQSARQFLGGHSRFLFWHVDLQGRQLLRLSEALMGDLGELRFPGLYVPGVVRLLRRRALVLGIDGFDELAAEQGSTDALGALALLVGEMRDQGCLAAASRRSFFDTDDYLRRSKLVRRDAAAATEFHELRLLEWSKDEVVNYLSQAVDPESGRRFKDPTQVYEKMLAELQGQASHPMLTRPFLVTQLARALLRYDLEPADFVRGLGDPLKGVAELVQRFVAREVSDKWKSKDTNEPYLTVEQHMQLLTTVAEEMHRSDTDRLDVDVLDTIVAILLDEWRLPQERRGQVAEMSRMHVLLPPPISSDFQVRTFDHPEFREYFVARALAALLQGGTLDALRNFLNVSVVSDSLARYVRTLLEADSGAMQLVLTRLQEIVSEEWRPTNIQQNVGTLLAPMLDRGTNATPLAFTGHVVISSIALEGSHLEQVTLEDVSLLNASLAGVRWENVRLVQCKVNELSIDETATFHNVVFDRCDVGGVRILVGGEEMAREYEPSRVTVELERRGIKMAVDAQLTIPQIVPTSDSEARRVLQKILATFRRTTTVTPDTLGLKLRGQERAVAINEVMPLMVATGVADVRPWRGQGTSKSVWALQFRVDQILEAESRGGGSGPLADFWKGLTALP
jgi:hypothetical protein